MSTNTKRRIIRMLYRVYYDCGHLRVVGTGWLGSGVGDGERASQFVCMDCMFGAQHV